ncbi:MAG: uracil-DNA glycosylase family protein [Sedimentisphaerales bacterium]|nr:uracil-DNA glycosylase family protein [Sedimentisphaerales bacterium]
MNNIQKINADKLSKLDVVMKDIAACQLCCGVDTTIPEKRRLRNLIAEKPSAPRYGEIPSHYTDWATRLNAKIVILMKDWGLASHALELRTYFEGLIANKSLNREQAWLETIQNRPKPSPTHKKIKKYLKISAVAEGLFLPPDFLNHIFFTNAVLCFRCRGKPNATDNIDLKKSLDNCCGKRKYLRQQLKIVNPAIVVALGQGAWQGLDQSGTIISSSSQKYLVIDYPDGLHLCVVRAPHPTKWGKGISDTTKINEYRIIWKALSHILGLSSEKLVETCFPTSINKVLVNQAKNKNINFNQKRLSSLQQIDSTTIVPVLNSVTDDIPSFRVGEEPIMMYSHRHCNNKISKTDWLGCRISGQKKDGLTSRHRFNLAIAVAYPEPRTVALLAEQANVPNGNFADYLDPLCEKGMLRKIAGRGYVLTSPPPLEVLKEASSLNIGDSPNRRSSGY